jgi:hypothetical protein
VSGIGVGCGSCLQIKYCTTKSRHLTDLTNNTAFYRSFEGVIHNYMFVSITKSIWILNLYGNIQGVSMSKDNNTASQYQGTWNLECCLKKQHYYLPECLKSKAHCKNIISLIIFQN